jgi:hypothetical protein
MRTNILIQLRIGAPPGGIPLEGGWTFGTFTFLKAYGTQL